MNVTKAYTVYVTAESEPAIEWLDCALYQSGGLATLIREQARKLTGNHEIVDVVTVRARVRSRLVGPG